MTRIANIFHNVAVDGAGRPRGFFGYEQGQPMILVFRAQIPEQLADRQVLADVFEEFNIGATSPAAVAYRDVHGLRSLSTGDMVELDGTYWSCDSYGWSVQPHPLIVSSPRPKAHPIGA